VVCFGGSTLYWHPLKFSSEPSKPSVDTHNKRATFATYLLSGKGRKSGNTRSRSPEDDNDNDTDDQTDSGDPSSADADSSLTENENDVEIDDGFYVESSSGDESDNTASILRKQRRSRSPFDSASPGNGIKSNRVANNRKDTIPRVNVDASPVDALAVSDGDENNMHARSVGVDLTTGNFVVAGIL
jgi:hypothetical protein